MTQRTPQAERTYYAANRESILARKRSYYQANKDRITTRQRAYHHANSEVIGISKWLCIPTPVARQIIAEDA